MKKVLFAFIFAILGIGVGTVYSKTLSNAVDNISNYLFKSEKRTEKSLSKNKDASVIKNPFDGIDAGIKEPTPAPLISPKTENPFANTQAEISNKEANHISQKNQRVGIEIQTDLDVFEDEQGFYVEDPIVGEVYEVYEDEIEFD